MAQSTGPANIQIWYTSTDGNIVTPNDTTAFGVNIVSNTYSSGKGIIRFDGNASGRLIKVPAASVNAYKAAANWSTYASSIVAQ